MTSKTPIQKLLEKEEFVRNAITGFIDYRFAPAEKTIAIGDFCTGSGKLAKKIYRYIPYAKVIGFDIAIENEESSPNLSFEQKDVYGLGGEYNLDGVVFQDSCGPLADASLNYAIKHHVPLVAGSACCYGKLLYLVQADEDVFGDMKQQGERIIAEGLVTDAEHISSITDFLKLDSSDDVTTSLLGEKGVTRIVNHVRYERLRSAGYEVEFDDRLSLVLASKQLPNLFK